MSELWSSVCDGCGQSEGNCRCERRRKEREAKRDEAVAQLVEALRLIAAQQPKTLQTLRDNGFVFDDIGSEPGNWQHAAFTVYSDLCEVDKLANDALTAFDAKETPCEKSIERRTMTDLETRAKAYAKAKDSPDKCDLDFEDIEEAYLAGAREQARIDSGIADRHYEAFGNGAKKIAKAILANVGERSK